MKNKHANKNLLTISCGLILYIIITLKFHSPYLLFCTMLLFIYITLLFYFFKSIFKNSIYAVSSLIIFILASSFLKNIQIYITISSIVIMIIGIITKYKNFQHFFDSSITRIKTLPILDIIVWTGIFLLTNILILTSKEGIHLIDYLHPMYELSIGRSYGLSLLNPPDLSFAGKFVRFHFLSTQIPNYFSNIFQINPLQAAYILLPQFYLFLMFIVIHIIFNSIPSYKTPIAILFFTPLWLKKISSVDSLMTKFLFFNYSYSLGFILILIIIYFLLHKKHVLLYISLIALILIKVSMFITLFGGFILYYLRQKQWKRMLTLVTLILPVFLILYIIFLSDAHQHNLWLIFPTYLYFPIYEHKYFSLLIIILLVVYIVYRFYIKINKLEINDRKPILLLSSITFSGFLGLTLLTETTEANSMQFWYANYITVPIILWYFIKYKTSNNNTKKIRRYVIIIAINILLFFSFITIYYKVKRVMLAYFNNTYKISNEIIEAYTWLDTLPEKGIVIFGKHYEDDTGQPFWPITSFVRSALSGKQMYCENYKYKGIIMQDRFSLRFAELITFYSSFVKSSQKSQELLSKYFKNDFGSKEGHPQSSYTNQKEKLKYLLSLKKEWYYNNTITKVNHEIREYLKKTKPSREWLRNFLRNSRAKYIVLENRDTPNDLLTSVTTLIYKNNTIQILKVKSMR